MHLDPRPFIGRLRWIRQYPAYSEAPARYAARSVAFTWREQVTNGETMAFKACGGCSFRSPRNNISSFIAAVFDQRDLNIVRFWKKALPAGAVFFDIGANIGLYTVPAALHVGRIGRVVAFEAHPVIAGFLRDNVARNRVTNVAMENMAVGEANGQTRIAFNDRNPGETHIAAGEEEGELVPIVSLDSYCARHDIRRVDYMKLDVEGYEAAVLRGARDIVAASPNILLQTEYEPAHLSRYGAVDALARLLTEWGFKPYSIEWATGQPRPISSVRDFAGEIVWSRAPL